MLAAHRRRLGCGLHPHGDQTNPDLSEGQLVVVDHGNRLDGALAAFVGPCFNAVRELPAEAPFPSITLIDVRYDD